MGSTKNMLKELRNEHVKFRINRVLPIALALILPVLSFFSNVNQSVLEDLGFWGGWVGSSILLFSVWYLLWFTWNRGFPWLPLAGLVLLAIIFSGLIYFLELEVGRFRVSVTIIRFILMIILFLAIQFALKTQENISRLLVEKEQIQTDHYRLQLKALQNQVDPHFLFNSLNTLRSMVRQKDANSEPFILSLSQFYRHTLKHNEASSLRLSDEIEVLESYLFLMKSRNEAAVKVNISIDASVDDFRLPTFALQTVVENCFKHNSMTSKNPLHISLLNTEADYIQVQNNRQPKIGDQEPSGFGLDLLRKRYALMGIEQGVLIEETPTHFTVKLKLMKPWMC